MLNTLCCETQQAINTFMEVAMKVLVTGGAGFIGANAARYFANKGYDVVAFDNLSRAASQYNRDWLINNFPKVEFIKGDIRNVGECNKLFQEHSDVSLILHLAGQVAVTTSVIDPREDFETNAIGTFNVLESIRKYCPDCPVIYSSTNKVYGRMETLEVVERKGRYVYADLPTGVSEDHTLDFHSPYGCSKGAADQYVRDYARIYGLKTIVFRQSCIYGYRQFGVEDQGWVAWFTIASVVNRPITIYGDGKQVRDILFIDDLVNAFDMAYQNIEKTSGQIYNIGGGPDNTLSLLELLGILEKSTGKKIDVGFSDWRPGDQKVFISNIQKALTDYGWMPEISVNAGVRKLYDWVSQNKATIASAVGD
jgi:CDP-paratose 2-epimerase